MTKKQTNLFSYKTKLQNPTDDDLEENDFKDPPPKKTPAKTPQRQPQPKPQTSTPKRKRNDDAYISPEHAKKKAKLTWREKKKEEPRWDWMENVRDANMIKENEPNYDPQTLYIPQSSYTGFTPFQKQYWDIKRTIFSVLVFIKIGNFYHLYERDAQIGRDEFDLAFHDETNMCYVGVPENSIKHWVSKFSARGYKVAVVEQMETSNEAKNRSKSTKATYGSKETAVTRELTQIFTAGTLVDPDMITDSTMNNYILSVKEHDNKFGVCFVDAASCEVNLGYLDDDANFTAFETLIQQIVPKELLFERGNLSKRARLLTRNPQCTPSPRRAGTEFWDASKTRFELEGVTETPTVSVLKELLVEYQENDLVMSAFGGMWAYLRELKLDDSIFTLANFKKYDPTVDAKTMILDGQTLANLEILKNSTDGDRRGSLIEFLDFCATSFGQRMFRNWVCHPLRNISDIIERQDAIEELERASELVETIRTRFKKIPDLERNLGRIHSECIKKDHYVYDKNVNVKKIKLLLDTFKGVEDAWEIMLLLVDSVNDEVINSLPLFEKWIEATGDIGEELEAFKNAFDHDLARSDAEIRPVHGKNPTYDKLNEQLITLQEKLDNFLVDTAEKLKIPSAKLEYASLASVKDKYLVDVQLNYTTKVDQLTGWEMVKETKKFKRYRIADIQNTADELAIAQEKLDVIIKGEIKRAYMEFDKSYSSWKMITDQVAQLDCLISLSMVSNSGMRAWCKPEFVTDSVCLDLEEMVHPCVIPPDGTFIPNDTKLGDCVGRNGLIEKKPRTCIVTGANMGGKSTILRQNCIAVILAQLGCKVPATRFRLSPVDRVFTRIGANDRIMSGESTFMVELNETSNILRNATERSLIILDELGRGTSTFDGYAIAYAVTRFLSEKVKCRTLFSTHYFYLTEELFYNPFVSLYQMAVNENSKTFDVTFLYRFIEGVSPESYGLSVAKKAGIPRSIILKASAKAKEFSDYLQLKGGQSVGGRDVFSTVQRAGFDKLYGCMCNPENVSWDKLQQQIWNVYRTFK